MSNRSNSTTREQQSKSRSASDLQAKKIKVPLTNRITLLPAHTAHAAPYIGDKRLGNGNGVTFKPKLTNSNPAISSQAKAKGVAVNQKQVDKRRYQKQMSDTQHQQTPGQQRPLTAAGSTQPPRSSKQQPVSARPPPLRLPSSRAKNPTSQLSQGGYLMHRAEGMFDLSNLNNTPGYKGSIYNLLEEFQKQYEISSVPNTSPQQDAERKFVSTEGKHTGLPTATQDVSSSKRKEDKLQIYQQQRISSQISPRSTQSQDSHTTRPLSSPARPTDTTVPLQLLAERKMDSKRVTTDSEEELLAQILLTMSRSNPHKDEESDYANLWDSESGQTDSSAVSSNRSSFQTNKDVMGSLLRTKVNRQHSQDNDRRKAWINYSESTMSSSQTETDAGSMYPFDMDKFKSLKDKANNLDLTLTDFFSDLKHSNSILELSKLFTSTNAMLSSDCKYMCHQSCEDLLTEQCTGPKRSPTDCDDGTSERVGGSKSKHRHDADDADSGYSGSGGSAGFTLTKEEICSKIKAYNESVGKSSGTMTLPANGSDSFQGVIKVCISIDRAINMSLSSRPTSIYEVLDRESELSPQTSPENTVVSNEQLPKNAVVSLHTTSHETACEVVGNLLNKFKITDNPKSFALFEQTIKNEKEVKLRKVADKEHPLINYLRWSTESSDYKRFVLKENDSGDIMYEAFSIPELNNFLRVLEAEEALKLTDIQQKYLVRRKQLADRLREVEDERHSTGGGTASLKTSR